MKSKEPKQLIKNRNELHESQHEEYGYSFCQWCNISTRMLDCHHIIFRSEAPGHVRLHSKQNLILLCRPCHNWIHSKKTNRDKLVEIRNLKQLFDGKEEV